MPISNEDYKLFPFLLMYGDETVLDAVAAFRDQRAQNFWQLVVDLGDGKYAVTTFGAVSTELQDGKKELLDSTLDSLVGTALKLIEVVAEQSTSDKSTVENQAWKTDSQMVAVVDQGEFKGLLRLGGPRREGLFGSDLVKLAGQYSDLPTTGLVSRRRQEAMAARKKKSD